MIGDEPHEVKVSFTISSSNKSIIFFCFIVSGDGQVDFNEFMTILGPKLLSSETREGFLGSTIDTIFWQVKLYPLKSALGTLLSHESNGKADAV